MPVSAAVGIVGTIIEVAYPYSLHQSNKEKLRPAAQSI